MIGIVISVYTMVVRNIGIMEWGHIKAGSFWNGFFTLLILIGIAAFGCAIGERRILEGSYEKPAIVVPETVESQPAKSYSINGITHYPLSNEDGFVQEGVASWYGKEFHGRKTSSGEIYNMHEKTAAHKTLPFGTYLKVENLSNQREVIVKVNDRGPFVKGRIIDLSFAAGKEIGLIDPGVTKVRLVALSKKVGTIKMGDKTRPLVAAKNFKKGKYTVQVGAFQNRDNAMRLAERLRIIFDPVTITTYIPVAGTILYRVRVSVSEDLNKTAQVVKKLEYLGFSEAFIVAL
jgi:rare lipoprotein A